MKRTMYVLLLLAAALTGAAQEVMMWDETDMQPGDSIAPVKYEVVYDMCVVTSPDDTLNKPFTEQMLLQVGPNRSAFYSYQAYQTDSVVTAALQRGEAVNINMSSRVSWKLYKNYPEAGQTTFMDKVANDRYAVTEPTEVPHWQLVPDSADHILGYAVHLAKTHFKGREWLAWYASDIPIDNGPWKLQGLPGLILKACDTAHEYCFDVAALRNISQPKAMTCKKQGYAPIKRKELYKIYQRYYADPIGYTLLSYPASSTNSIKITDKDGNELKHSKPVPFNPIER